MNVPPPPGGTEAPPGEGPVSVVVPARTTTQGKYMLTDEHVYCASNVNKKRKEKKNSEWYFLFFLP